jgi:D-hexose-6-phosphate mutarotase
VEIIELTSAYGRARVCDKGAHVMDAEFGGVPLLWLSPMADLQAGTPGTAIRGGVPVCFPWFGKDPAGGPAHGFARITPWRLADRSADRAVFALDDDEATRRLWPHPFHAELTIGLDDALTFTFSVMNTGRDDMTFTYALHGYFAAALADGVRVDGLDGLTRSDLGMPSTQAGPVVVDGYVDGIFQNAPSRVLLHAGERTVTVDARDMSSAVVWNAGPNEMPDIRDGWRDYVCVERGRVGAAGPVVAAGETYTATMRLSAI